MIPEELRQRQQWLVWRYEINKKNPQGKPLKTPYYARGGIRHGAQGTPEDRAKLVTLETALAAVTKAGHQQEVGGRGYQGVGFAFLAGDGLIGIDLDGMIDADGVVSDRAIEIIGSCNSFTEYSPSGKGMHIFVLGKTTTAKCDDIGVEIYCNAQYFTVTGNHYSTTSQQVNPISPLVLAGLHSMVAAAKAEAKAKKEAAKRASEPAAATKSAPAKGGGRTDGKNDFADVNAAAIQNLDAWVPTLFPTAKRSPIGYRVAQADLGRDLQEDLSITTKGIIDYGVGDMGDARDGKRTPIDLVIEWSAHKTPKEALHWLAAQLGITLAKPYAKKKPGAAGTAPKPRTGGAAAGGGDEPPDEGDAPIGEDEPSEQRPPPLRKSDMPTIEWRQGELPAIVDAAEQALIDSDAGIFQRAGSLVRVVRRDTPSIRNYKRPSGMLGLHPVDQSYLVEEFTRVAEWEKYDSRAKVMRAMNAPKEVAATYLSRVGRWKVPRLWSVISAPTLRPDGTVLQKPGYDHDTSTWYGPGETKFPRIPDNPTRDDALAALEHLQAAFKSLPCESEVDRAVLLALVLTSLVRRSLPTAPIGGITAPDAGTGKTLLADAVSILATGASVPTITFPDSDEEAAKIALAVLYEGDAVVLFDNVTRPMQGDWLCSILTQETFRGRLLGRTEMITAPTTTQWLATGNQLVFEGDLALRALLCRLDAKCERPDARVFEGDLRIQLLEKRPALVAAGLTVMRAFIAQGERMSDYCDPWGRFEQWSEMVRAPLIWLGTPDPNESRAAITGNDPKRDALDRFLRAWWLSFKEEKRTAIEVIKHATGPAGIPGAEALEAVLQDICQDRDKNFNSKKLGIWLGRHVGRRVEGMHIIKDGKDTNGSWQWVLINAKKGA